MQEPERIRIQDPGSEYMSIRKVGGSWVTTHQAADGSWYEVVNEDTPEANMRLYSEDNRNEGFRLKAMLEEEDRIRSELK